MKKLTIYLACTLILNTISILPAFPADAGLIAVRLNRQHLGGIGLKTVPPIVPEERIISGTLANNKVLTLFEGQELMARIFATGPVKTIQTEPLVVDEYVYILSGKLVLTGGNGKPQEFVAGDALMVPKGFKGTWEMHGNYRELHIHRPIP